MDEMDEYQEWLHMTWGFGLSGDLPCIVQQVAEVSERKEG